MEEPRVLLIDPRDNVAVALTAVPRGTPVTLADGEILPVAQDIPAGHKLARRALAAGEDVIKYGAPIGHATQDIAPGDWVHTHNVETNLSGPLDYRYEPTAPVPGVPRADTFLGYPRAHGRAGTRNEIWILPTVGCVNSTCRRLEREARQAFAGRKIDGIYAMSHPYGCSQMGDDLKNTHQILADLAVHPNAGGVLVVGLGCEGVQIDGLRRMIGEENIGRIAFYNTQDTEDEVEYGLALLGGLVDKAELDARVPVSMEKLVLGLKCGGSDGFSGLTANPLIGRMADRAVDCGGTALLTEVPEMFGAETRLMARARDEGVYRQVVDLINNYKNYLLSCGQPIYDNPSPGNKRGGITTLEDKSLGCTMKGGTRPVSGVLAYGERAQGPGLLLVESASNDMVASTALMAAGSQLILFSTGRGTPMGTFVPTLKIGTNTPMSARKAGWIDYDAGVLVTGRTMEEAEAELWALIRDMASGRVLARNEENEDREMTIFKSGVTV